MGGSDWGTPTMRPIILSALAWAAFASPAALCNVLEGVPVGGTVSVQGLSLGSKASGGELPLRHIEVRAPGARTFLAHADGKVEALPADGRRWFVSADKGLSQRIALALEPGSDRFTGIAMAPGGSLAFEGRVVGKALTVTSSSAVPQAPQAWTCGNEAAHGMVVAAAGPDPIASLRLAKGSSIHQAVVAVETDFEFLSAKFGGSTINATAYLDQLFALMNTLYERDLDVRLLRGDTYLYAADTDPWTATSTSSQVNEVGAYWMANRGSIDRAFVAFLSGKGISQFSASGIAWVLTSGNYCAATGTPQGVGQVSGHYSATQVFKFAGSTAAHDLLVIAHEIGHNFGAYHSHCTGTSGVAPTGTSTVDQCFTGDTVGPTACFVGAPVCPNDNSLPNAGSLMSYCHFSGPNGADCANDSLPELHPVHQGILDARVATNIANSCFSAAGGVPLDRVFYNGFE